MKTRLGVFAKHWTPGRVKTRLAAAIGAESAAGLHRAFFETLVTRFAAVADERCVFFTPAEHREAFADLADGAWQLHAQCEGDLGERMAAFFRQGFEAGAERIALIGSDSPNVPAAFIEQAFSALDEAEVVLGPSLDGGYYLIAARGGPPPVFDNIAWGGRDVLATTILKLAEHGATHKMLPVWYDVDELADLKTLAANLASDAQDGSLAKLRMSVEAVLRGGDVA